MPQRDRHPLLPFVERGKSLPQSFHQFCGEEIGVRVQFRGNGLLRLGIRKHNNTLTRIVLAVTDGRNIVADADASSLAVGGALK